MTDPAPREFTCERGELRTVLQRLQLASQPRDPMFGAVRFDVRGGGRVAVRACSGHLWGEGSVQIEGPAAPGWGFELNLRDLQRVVSAASSRQVAFRATSLSRVAVEAGRLTVTFPDVTHEGGRVTGLGQVPGSEARFCAPGLSSSPVAAKDNLWATLRDADLDTVARVATAVSTDESRPILTAVAFSGTTVAATDSYRLYVGDLEGVDLGDPLECEALVSGTMIRAAASCQGDRWTIAVGDRATGVVVHGAHSSWVEDREPGNFPNWRGLIPAQCEATTTFNREELLTAVREMVRVSAMSRGPWTGTSIRMFVSAGRATITVGAKTTGAEIAAAGHQAVPSLADENMYVRRLDCCHEGDPAEIGFNGHYLLDVIRQLRADEVEMGSSGSLKPIIFREPPFSGLIMPIRIR